MSKARIYRIISMFIDRLQTRYWKLWIKNFERDSFIHGRVYIHYPENLKVGNYTTINHGVVINARAPVLIGDYVHLSYGVIITTSGLDLDNSYKKREHVSKKIVLENGVWVGGNSILLPGITVGQGSVVGAGSVVTKDVAPYTIVAGSPAREIRKISRERR